jgi:hypothetical protein
MAVENCTESNTSNWSESDKSIGYRDIVFFRDTFIAVGTGGRMDRIFPSGEIIPIVNSLTFDLNCVSANNELLIAAGRNGTILYSTDGQRFDHVKSGTDKNIYSIAFYNGMILAGTENGVILGSHDGKFWNALQTNARGNILSLSANDSFLIGITDESEIIKSVDGFEWTIKYYNKEYSGYAPYSKFKKILATRNTIVIIGTHADGSPSILMSSLGQVWADRVPMYHDDEKRLCYLTEKPNGLTYDPVRDQFILACDSGALFSLPSCTKCNEYIKISDRNLYGISFAENCLCIAGEKFSVHIQRF